MRVLANASYIEAKVNGKGPFTFGVDTGSMTSPFAEELALEMGFDSRPSVRTGQPVEFTLDGDLKVSIPASFASFENLWGLPGLRVYGDIGFGVLRHFVVEFDYEHETLTLFDPHKYRYTGSGSSVSAVLVDDYDPQIEGDFTLPDGSIIPSKFTIDTGAGGTVISAPLVKRHDLLRRVKQQIPLPASKAKADGVNGLVFDAITSRISRIRLGNYSVERPLVALSRDTDTVFATDSLGVNLGGNVLRRFKVIVDYPGRRVILEPNGHFRDPFLADASGLVLAAEGSDFRTIVVRALVEGSPADEGGVKEGDIITAVDGESTDRYALWQLQDLFKDSGRERRVTIKRAGAIVTLAIKLRALV